LKKETSKDDKQSVPSKNTQLVTKRYPDQGYTPSKNTQLVTKRYTDQGYTPSKNTQLVTKRNQTEDTHPRHASKGKRKNVIKLIELKSNQWEKKPVKLC
jgi:hypothetical protein